VTLRNAILGLLAESPKTGFDLLKDFDVARSVLWPAPQNEVYRVLRQLADTGLIEETAKGPRGARTYAVTEAGRTELAAWLRAPSDFTLRYEPMLKAVFLKEGDPALRRQRAIDDAAFFKDQLAYLEQVDAGRTGPDPRRDARRMALHFYRAMAAWSVDVLDDV
jgi:DNA-binding PadR family transcriptional regulator